MAAPAFPVAQPVQANEKEPVVEQKAPPREEEEEPDYPDFSGKWKIVSTDNLQDFCEAAEISGSQYTMQKKAEKRMVQVIEQDGNVFTVQMQTQTFERELTYTINAPSKKSLEYRDQHKNIISANAKWSKDGEAIILKCKVYAKGVDPNEEPDDFTKRREVRYLKKGKMYEEITVNDETLIRKFQKKNELMDRSLQQLEAIEYLSSDVSIIPEMFEDVELNDARPRILRINNHLKIKYDIKFEFGEKNVLPQVLSKIPYLQHIMDGYGSYIFLADLIESYYKIQREIYEGNLKGEGNICFGIKEEFELNKQITKWCVGNKIGDSMFSIQLALKNSFSDRKYECVLVADDYKNENNENNENNEGESGEVHVEDGESSLNWKIDEFSDFNATDWPLLLSVYNENKWTPQFISNQLMFMINECVTNNIQENINEFNKNNGGKHIVKTMEDNGDITIDSRVWDHFYVDMSNIKPLLGEWMNHLFTDQCVYDFRD